MVETKEEKKVVCCSCSKWSGEQNQGVYRK